MGYDLKDFRDEFSTLSQTVLLQVFLDTIDKHTLILSWKLSPSFVLLAYLYPCHLNVSEISKQHPQMLD
jgi:hypothetical protein